MPSKTQEIDQFDFRLLIRTFRVPIVGCETLAQVLSRDLVLGGKKWGNLSACVRGS